MAGNQDSNPEDFTLLASDYVPEGAESAVVNNWDNEVKGNYWNDLDGYIYEIPGDNDENPVDEYPLDEEGNVRTEPEAWSDSLEIYESETPDGRIDVNSFCTVRWKVRWVGNGTILRNGLTMMIRANGSGVDELLGAEYLDEWWTVNFNHTEPALLEFSVYSASSYGMTEFVQLVENVEIIWDRIIVIVVTTNTNITTITGISDITTVNATSTTIPTSIDFGLPILVGVLGTILLIIVIVYVIKRKW